MDQTRLIATVAIWTAAAVMFVGGFARMSWDGLGGVFWVLGVIVLFMAVERATKWVWAPQKCDDVQVADREDA